MLMGTVQVEEPFDLAGTLRALGVGRIDSRGVWWWATVTERGTASMAIERVSGGVRASAWGEGASLLMDRVPQLVGLDDPFRPSQVKGPARDIVRRAAGLKLGATGDVHGSLVRTILEQVVTRPESMRSLRGLVAAYGPLVPGPRPLRAVPPPDVLASLSYEDLHTLGIERRRAATLIEVSRRAARLAAILHMGRDEGYARLTSIRGVGPWSAAAVMGEAWGDRDAVMVGDYHLPNTVAWALAGEERGSDERMLELLEPYRPFRRHVIVALVQAAVHAPRRGPRTEPRRHL